MASKYAKLRDKLPVFQQESSFQEKVDVFKSKYGENAENANVSAVAANYADLRARKQFLEDEISDINIALEALNQIGVTAMQADDLEKVSLSTGATVYLSYDVYPSVKDKEALLTWVKANKMSAQLTLPWQTLRGICNDLSSNGKPLPKGVEAYLRISLRIRNGDKHETTSSAT